MYLPVDSAKLLPNGLEISDWAFKVSLSEKGNCFIEALVVHLIVSGLQSYLCSLLVPVVRTAYLARRTLSGSLSIEVGTVCAALLPAYKAPAFTRCSLVDAV